MVLPVGQPGAPATRAQDCLHGSSVGGRNVVILQPAYSVGE